MKMYKDDIELDVDRSQVALLTAAGWTLVKQPNSPFIEVPKQDVIIQGDPGSLESYDPAAATNALVEDIPAEKPKVVRRTVASK